ncbi:MAG TPA: AI-2E family transporter [Candidatus Nitrosocosmicus sp.]|nr:AI-2E family transporter [Candidatus Nitrosocosmicus sp.]
MKPARHESPEPRQDHDKADLQDLLPTERALDIRSVSLTGLFVLATFYTLYFARDFILPILLAWILSSLLAPVVRALKRVRVAEPLSALLIISALLGILSLGIYRMSDPVASWIQRAPQVLTDVRAKLQNFIRPVTDVQETTKQIEKMTGLGNDQQTAAVELKKPGLSQVIFSGAKDFALSTGVMLVLLYFLLASGDLFLLKLVKVLPTMENKKVAVEIYRRIEKDVSTYLSVVTLIYIGFGCVIGVAMYLLGMPNPWLWGVMAAVLSYIPYLGALVGLTTVTLVAILTFEDVFRIVLVPLVYFTVDTIQANLIFPMALGRRLALNPVMIFIWLIFCGWIWGIIGALLAVPLLAIIKIICDQVEQLAPIGEFLGTESKAAPS